MCDEMTLPAECGHMLSLAVLAVMQNLSSETIEVDEADNLGPLKLARVGPKLAIVERFANRAKSRPHGFAAYRIEEERDGAFKIDPMNMLFVLQVKHFDTLPEYHLQLIQDPHTWYNSVVTAIHVALERIGPRPN